MHIQLLGPVRVTVDGRTVELSARQQILLAVLALEPGRVVEGHRLMQAVWGAGNLPTVNALAQLVSRLRNITGLAVTGHAGGYVLEVDASRVDLHRFRQLVADARSVEDDEAAGRLFAAALELWRGDPFTELAGTPFWDGIRAGLHEERRSVVTEARERGDRPRRTVRVPRQLPAALRDFTGRESYLEELTGRAGRVVIEGVGGVGKTALAVKHAHDVADRFPDGQFYLNLRGFDPASPPLSPSEAVSQLLRAMGIASQRIPADLAEQRELYRVLLRDRRALFVLDNAATAAQVRPLLPPGDTCLVLVTSRNRLNELDAEPLFLDRLEPDEAVALLTGIVGPRANGESAEELVRLCGHLPLAIRIAAAKVTVTSSLEDIVAELRENRLGALAIEDDEQFAVRATFDLSYASLDESRRTLFRRLGLVPGPTFTEEAAAQLAEGADVSDLVAANLVERNGDRYQLHNLLSLYARELATADDDRAREKLLRWYANTTDDATRLVNPERSVLEPADTRSFTDFGAAARWLEDERANLVAVARQAAESGPRCVAWRLADSLHSYFRRRRLHADWFAIGDAGLAAAQREKNLRGEAAVYSSLSHARLSIGQMHQAIEHGTRALALAEQDDWREGVENFLGVLADTHREVGDLETAVAYYERSIATGRPDATGHVFAAIGAAYRMQGRLTEALEHQERAVACTVASGARLAEAFRRARVGGTLRDLGRLDEAVVCMAGALALLEEVGRRGDEAYVLDDLSWLERDRGRYDLAVRYAERALHHAEELGEPIAETDARNNLAEAYHRRGDLVEAREQYQRSIGVTQRIGYRHGEVQALIGLGTVTRHVEHLDQALAIARRSGYRLLEGQALTALAAIHLERDEVGQAMTFGADALALHRRSGHRIMEARTLTVLGHKDPAHWDAALEIFTALGAPEADHLNRRVAGTAGR